MFIYTAKLTRRRAVSYVLLLGLAAGLLILLVGLAQNRGEKNLAATNEARIAFLQSYGWELAPDPIETLDLLLPAEPESSYAAYNALQKEQGFDLSPHLGQRMQRFTYRVTNHPAGAEDVQANLYLCENKVVAGDIFSPGENGFQATLKFPK